MHLCKQHGFRAIGSHLPIRKLGRQQCSLTRLQKASNGAGSRLHGVGMPLQTCRRPQAAAAAASPLSASLVEYQVDGSTYSACLRGGSSSNGTGQQQLLRLREESLDSEYVVVLPTSLSGVLLEVLERALQCVNTGNEGRPLELHHTVLAGSRTFKCSLMYNPGPQQLVTVTVQEVGRSCVQLPVSPQLIQPVTQLLQLLQTAAGQQPTPLLGADGHTEPAPAREVTPAAPAATHAAAEPGVPTALSNSSSSYEVHPVAERSQEEQDTPEQQQAQQQEQEQLGFMEAPAAAAEAESSSSSSESDSLGTVAAAASPAEAAPIETAETAGETAAAGASAAAAAAASATSTAAAAEAVPAAAAAAAAPGTSTDCMPTRSPSSLEALFATIEGSSSINEGFAFAHAAAAEALSAAGSADGSTAQQQQQRMFQLPHLCCMWGKLPQYAARMQRDMLGPEMYGDEEAVSDEEVLSRELLPEVKQELQALLQVLVPLMQPHLPELPRHMLQRLLQAATDAQLQLPQPFLTAWTAAATAPAARGSWQRVDSKPSSSSSSGGDGADINGRAAAVAGLLDVSFLLLGAGIDRQQQWEQVPVVLPLQWCAYGLAEATRMLQECMQSSQSLLYGGSDPEQLAGSAESQAEQQQLQQLVPVLLAACGHQMQQQQLLWQPGDAISTTSSSSSSSSSSSTATHLTSVSNSLQQLLAPDCSQYAGLPDAEAALLPGLQQGFVVGGLLGLLQHQQASAVGLVWSWLAFGGGAQQCSSTLLRTLLERLPYDQAAAAYATAAAAAANSSDSSSAVHGSLIEHVLVDHTSSISNNSSSSNRLVGDRGVEQLESLLGLLLHTLQADSRAAFAALPSLLASLSSSVQASTPTSNSSSSSSSSSERWDQAVAELCDQLQQMLQLGPQQLLVHAAAVVHAAAQLSTAAAASSRAAVTVLQLTEQLADAADSWHAAAAADPNLQERSEVDVPSTEFAAGMGQVPTAAEVVRSCLESVPAWAQVCARQQQQEAAVLPVLSELLSTAAALQEDHGQHASLAPAWLAHHNSSGSKSTSSSTGSSSSGSGSTDSTLWASFEPVLLSAAANSSNTALDNADHATSAASLLVLLGPQQQPSEQLLQVYWAAVGPEALGLSATGLQQLLWVAAATLTRLESATAGSNVGDVPSKTEFVTPSRSSSSSGSGLLRLAGKACSSLAVRPASALSARQAARLTWALAQLSASQAAAAVWSPPHQVLAWLKRVWQGMDGITGSSSSSSSRWAGGGVEGVEGKVEQLQHHGVLTEQEVEELVVSLQQLGLLQQQQQVLPADMQVQEEVQQGQASAAAVEQGSSSVQEQRPAEEPAAPVAVEQPEPHPQQQQQQLQQEEGKAATQKLHPLLLQQQKLKQQQQQQRQGEQQSKHTVHDFSTARPKAAGVDAGVAAATTAGLDTPHGPVSQAAAAAGAGAVAPATDAASVEADAAEAIAPAAAVSPYAEIAGAVISAAATEQPPAAAVLVADAQQLAGAAAATEVEASTTAAATAPAAADEEAGTAATEAAAVEAGMGVAAGAEAEAAAQADMGAEAAAEGEPEAAGAQEVPSFVFDTLQELQQPGFQPTQRQAMQLLLPVQPYVAALPAVEVILYVASCMQSKVPLSTSAQLAAARAVAAAVAISAQGVEPEQPVPASLVLQLLSTMADAVTTPASTPAAGAIAGQLDLQQQTPQLLQQLLPALGPQQLAAASAAELLQLLRDTFTLSTGSKPPTRSQLPLGTTLFGTAAAGSTTASPSSSSAVDQAWLVSAAAALEPKLLLFPHASQLLQCLQLLQALGLQQPGSAFMGSLLAAADALIDTLSGRNCLELLAASAAAGQLPSRSLTHALLQQLQPVKLPAGDVCAGCRLLAALGVRPSAELLVHWFSITEAAAEVLQPQQVLQVLWACCVWRLQPPTGWLTAVLKGMLLPGRLTACSSATLAGVCHCLWQLGAQPAPGFVAAVAAAAEYSIVQPEGSSSSGGWQYGGQKGQPRQQQQQEGGAIDAESLSVLCYCLFMWQHASTPAWKVAVADAAVKLIPTADGPSVLRMGLHLSSIFSDADSSLDSEQSYPWQEALLKALPQLLPISTHQRCGQDVLLAADGSAYSAARQIPVWALVVVSYLLGLIPEQTLPVARAVVAATAVAAEREALTAWDASVLLPSCVELVDILQEAASTAEGPLAVLQVQKMQQEAMQVQDVLEGLLKYVYQHRDGAPAAVLQALPVVAAQVGVEMPQQSRKILEAAEAAAQEREQQLQQALLLHEQGGPAMPEDLLQGWDELGHGEPGDVVARYAEEPLQAALVRRMYWLGAAVTDGWVLRSLSG